jgi:hypothetical protein
MAALPLKLRRFPIVLALLIAAAAAHGTFAWVNRDRRPDMIVLEAPPGPTARTALAFGDAQFLYRSWAAHLQNAGDTGGRATPMRDYNYDYVLGWLQALQALDRDAQQHAFLAAHYFSQTPKLDDVRRLVDFIIADVRLSPARKWYWLTYVMTLAQRKLDDLPYALEISRELASYDFPDMDGYNYLFTAIYLERLARYDEARDEVARVVETKRQKLGPPHLAWVEQFTQGLAEKAR